MLCSQLISIDQSKQRKSLWKGSDNQRHEVVRRSEVQPFPSPCPCHLKPDSPFWRLRLDCRFLPHAAFCERAETSYPLLSWRKSHLSFVPPTLTTEALTHQPYLLRLCGIFYFFKDLRYELQILRPYRGGKSPAAQRSLL